MFNRNPIVLFPFFQIILYKNSIGYLTKKIETMSNALVSINVNRSNSNESLLSVKNNESEDANSSKKRLRWEKNVKQKSKKRIVEKEILE